MKTEYEKVLQKQLQTLETRGILKGKENVITGIKPAAAGFGPRYFLAGHGDRPFLLLNSNSYLGLSLDQAVITAEEEAARKFGCGPGGVRFISGTFQTHIDLEERLAVFHSRQAGMIFSAAYAAVMGVLPPLITKETVVLSDELNHNCIINAIRLSRPAAKEIYNHLQLDDLERKLQFHAGRARRVVLVTDGIFSMRGDHGPLDKIAAIAEKYDSDFPEGILTVADDSHGVGVFGRNGRGTEEYTGGRVDVLVATLGKALGVNGGYVVASRTVIDYLRESAPFYIYSNPITPAEAAAALKALEIVDSPKGLALLERVRFLTRRFEKGLQAAGFEFIAGEHPIVPLMIRNTEKTAGLVRFLLEHGVLATGIKFPVVPEGDEEVRFQVSANHTEKDIDYVLELLTAWKK
ncbi:MAG: aminotransferase class I/II-fold pyridoxal phosphate-dependent enzyme [Deltaproteobacteria bacterium]|jgi:glycine C-acetyltransferase|nr:aminotransferase class I/II-fold pyridoxal phosphate-dependent enzyme [Deltaproteobacteria bacterium]